VLPVESINPATTPQTAPTTAQEKTNLDLVLNWWRETVQSRHHDLDLKYLAEKYVVHDMVRVENGLIKEHWDKAVLDPPQAPLIPR
jgi:predicted SnoaL-like aldol condensation-catalyzing enzyme